MRSLLIKSWELLHPWKWSFSTQCLNIIYSSSLICSWIFIYNWKYDHCIYIHNIYYDSQQQTFELEIYLGLPQIVNIFKIVTIGRYCFMIFTETLNYEWYCRGRKRQYTIVSKDKIITSQRKTQSVSRFFGDLSVLFCLNTIKLKRAIDLQFEQERPLDF